MNLHQLSEALGVDRAQLRRESRRSGFPGAGEGVFDVDAVRAWRSQNIVTRPERRERKAVRPPKVARRDAGASGVIEPVADADDPLVRELMTGDPTPLSISRFVVKLSAKQVAMRAVKGQLPAAELDALKKMLAELRAGEVSFLELEQKQGRLLEKSDVEATITAMVGRMVRALTVLESSIVTEFAVWLGDPAVREMGADGRARKVREFVAKQIGDVRRMEAEGVDALLKAAKADDGDE